MKHKAQESLKKLEFNTTTFDDDNSSFCYCENEIKNIQDLINCQLTVEELNSVIRTLEYELPCYDLSSQVDKQIQIIKKLKKQKEMWVK
ncbi:hypothetical protein [Methanobrevibacter sp.]|uniref:hypothetical protein n=1 Tax=Methanobrevibacter sp. TaxID=66852 RepID=UPI0038902518